MTEFDAEETIEGRPTGRLVALLEILLVIGMVLVAVGCVVSATSGLSVAVEVTDVVDLPARFDAYDAPTGAAVEQTSGPSSAQVGGPVSAHLRILGATTDLRVIWVVWRVATAAVVLAGLGLVLSIVRSAKRGDPFVQANVRRLWWLAGVVAIGGNGVSMVGGFATMLLIQRSAAADVVGASSTLGTAPILGGLVAAVLAGVWQQGVRMRDDVAGMV